MSNNPSIPPALISVPRIRTLVASLIVSLASGTNYVSNCSLDYCQCRYESKKMLLGLFRWEARRRWIWSRKRLVDHISLCSLFTATGNTAEDISYAVERRSASWKWYGVPSIPAAYLTLFSRGLQFCSDMGTDCRFSWSSHTPCL